MPESNVAQPAPLHIKPKFRNLDDSSSVMTEASDSLPPSFASDSNPPPASSTPFEVIFNPRLKRTSTTNYRTELEAQQQKAEDDARSQLTRRESEKNTFDKMSAQNFKRQLSFTKPDDDSKIEAPIETIYTRDSSAIDEGKEKHSLLGDIKNKLHIGSPHSLHSHHQKHETDQSEQTKLSKYEFGLNVSDQLNSSNSSSISISDVSPNESTSYTQPHAKRKKSFNFNDYRAQMLKGSMSGQGQTYSEFINASSSTSK